MKPVLLVDDESMILELLEELLSDAGFDVVVANGGAEAILIIESNRDLGVVVTDVNMPDVDGFDVGGAALRLRPGLPVVFITGRPDALKDPRAPLDPTVVHKPFQVSQVIDVIHAVVEPG